jgi:hypothetical protein
MPPSDHEGDFAIVVRPQQLKALEAERAGNSPGSGRKGPLSALRIRGSQNGSRVSGSRPGLGGRTSEGALGCQLGPGGSSVVGTLCTIGRSPPRDESGFRAYGSSQRFHRLHRHAVARAPKAHLGGVSPTALGFSSLMEDAASRHGRCRYKLPSTASRLVGALLIIRVRTRTRWSVSRSSDQWSWHACETLIDTPRAL